MMANRLYSSDLILDWIGCMSVGGGWIVKLVKFPWKKFFLRLLCYNAIIHSCFDNIIQKGLLYAVYNLAKNPSLLECGTHWVVEMVFLIYAILTLSVRYVIWWFHSIVFHFYALMLLLLPLYCWFYVWCIIRYV